MDDIVIINTVHWNPITYLSQLGLYPVTQTNIIIIIIIIKYRRIVSNIRGQ